MRWHCSIPSPSKFSPLPLSSSPPSSLPVLPRISPSISLLYRCVCAATADPTICSFTFFVVVLKRGDAIRRRGAPSSVAFPLSFPPSVLQRGYAWLKRATSAPVLPSAARHENRVDTGDVRAREQPCACLISRAFPPLLVPSSLGQARSSVVGMRVRHTPAACSPPPAFFLFQSRNR